ncbi:hypothetical protein V6Z11_D12G044300 [Gossypium hirsutum]
MLKRSYGLLKMDCPRMASASCLNLLWSLLILLSRKGTNVQIN